MKRKILLMLIITLISISIFAQHQKFHSTFETGMDGWTIANDTGGVGNVRNH